MPDIFLSYSRNDEAKAQQFADAFKREGFDVWWDSSLRSGEIYDQVIEQALRQAKFVVVLWSPRSVESRWVRAEATEADRLGTLVPVAIEACQLPIIFELTHTTDLSHWSAEDDDKAWRQFIADLRQRLDIPAENPPATAPALPDKPSIAVLPFNDMTGSNEQDYFVDGMVVEIVNALSRFQSLFVIASGTSRSYKDDTRSPAQIATELGVRYILLGSVRKAGERVRIAVELLDEGARTPIWVERFDGTLEDVFALQDTVANAVASQIEPSIQAAEIRRANSRPTQDQGAYDYFLRGLHIYWGEYEKQPVLAAIEMFDQAIERDPDFALALAYNSNAYINLVVNDHTDDKEGTAQKALEYARRAVQAGADDAEVLAWAAYTFLQCGVEIPKVDVMIKRALALNPGAAVCRYCSGWTYLFASRPQEAIEEFEVGLRLDPRSPWRIGMICGLGMAMFAVHRYDDAIPLLLEGMEALHLTAMLLRIPAACHAHAGRLAEARAVKGGLDPPGSFEDNFISLFHEPEFKNLLESGLALAREEA